MQQPQQSMSPKLANRGQPSQGLASMDSLTCIIRTLTAPTGLRPSAINASALLFSIELAKTGRIQIANFILSGASVRHILLYLFINTNPEEEGLLKKIIYRGANFYKLC